MRVLNRLLVAGALLWMGLVAGCDSAPGPEELDRRSPVLSDFSFSPSGVVLEQLPPDQIDGEAVRGVSIPAASTDRETTAFYASLLAEDLALGVGLAANQPARLPTVSCAG